MQSRKYIFFRVILSLTLLFNDAASTLLYALSSGPSQPEFNGFAPVESEDLVDLFTGNFSYNIPLLDIEGYPVNLSYSAGGSMDDDASWVGFGWSLNPGSVTRQIAGHPDDFNGSFGDIQTIERNMKPNTTFGLGAGANVGLEFAGLGNVGLGGNVGVRYNNYNGLGLETGANISISAAKATGLPLSAGLGISNNSDEGITMQPNIGLSFKVLESCETNTSLSLSFGSAFNTRGGLMGYSLGLTASSNAIAVLPNENSKVSSVSSSTNFPAKRILPAVQTDMTSHSISGEFSAGATAFWLYSSATIRGYFSTQRLAESFTNVPLYGYLHSTMGQNDQHGSMDFFEDGSKRYNGNIPALSVPISCPDFLSVNAQGFQQTFQPQFQFAGTFSNRLTKSNSGSADLGAEVGVGNIAHVGATIYSSFSTSTSGRWAGENFSSQLLRFPENQNTGPTSIQYKPVGDLTPVLQDNLPPDMYSATPERVKLRKVADHVIYGDSKWQDQSVAGDLSARMYANENQIWNRSLITRNLKELQNYGGFNTYDYTELSGEAKDHHIAEVSVADEGGRIYVFGAPVYNTKKEEVSFAIGKTLNGQNGPTLDIDKNLVQYAPGLDNSSSNNKGIDNYFERVSTPGYAHSYLLTGLLEPNYVDSDSEPGPSLNDIGSYYLFKYKKTTGFKWRTPFTASISPALAGYNIGLLSDEKDDRASYIYGEKELVYLDTIESKNFVCVFRTSNREDGYGALNENGGISTTGPILQKLDRIDLYSRESIALHGSQAKPIKSVHFEYDYTLCPGIPMNVNGDGKLTLNKVYFTYGNVNDGIFSPYNFAYYHSIINNGVDYFPEYEASHRDRWGTYDFQDVVDNWSYFGDLLNWEYPYAEQDIDNANKNARLWNLKEIYTPSGSQITIEYEADSYYSTQNSDATRMFICSGVDSNVLQESETGEATTASLTSNSRFLIKKRSAQNTADDFKKDLDLENIYFKSLVSFGTGQANSDWEYVTGYAKGDIIESSVPGYVELQFDPVTLNDDGGGLISPISKAALNFGRLYLNKSVYNAADFEADGLGAQVIEEFIQLFANLLQVFNSPNNYIYNTLGKGRKIAIRKTWFKLNDPDGIVVGGGHRVSRITYDDKWEEAEYNAVSTVTGFEYDYSSQELGLATTGVAQNEPQFGIEESAIIRPIALNEKNKLAPDDRFYLEEPFALAEHGLPSIGYAAVTKKFIGNKGGIAEDFDDIGSQVHEFYTAREFPTFYSKTDIELLQDNSSASIGNIFKTQIQDYVTASQGFLIETNNMHGKQKAVRTFRKNAADPYESQEFIYHAEERVWHGDLTKQPINNGFKHLTPDGSHVYNLAMGYDVALTHQSHQERNAITGPNAQANAVLAAFGPFPAGVGLVLANVSYEQTQFRFLSTLKKIERAGILKETIHYKHGRRWTDRPVAYDANTGKVLVSEQTNDFGDSQYSWSYPAYWKYRELDKISKNWGHRFNLIVNSETGGASLSNANQLLTEGDILISPSNKLFWVIDVGANGLRLADKEGSLVGLQSGTYKVFKSGFYNDLSMPMMTGSSSTNPCENFGAGYHTNVLSMESWRFDREQVVSCNCLPVIDSLHVLNPFTSGKKGKLYQAESFVPLVLRDRTNLNGNSNVRTDGYLMEIPNYYQLFSNYWVAFSQNWVSTQTVRKVSGEGVILEVEDALGNYSAAANNFNTNLTSSVIKNSRLENYATQAFESSAIHEDSCSTSNIGFIGGTSSEIKSHTGKQSLRITTGNSAILSSLKESCLSDEEPEGDPCEFNVEWEALSSTDGYIIVSGSNANSHEVMQIQKLSGGDASFEIVSMDSIYVSKSAGTLNITLSIVPYLDPCGPATWTNVILN